MNILHQAARRLERLEALDKVAKPRAGAVGRAVRPRVVRNLLVAGRGLAGCCVLGNEFEDAQVGGQRLVLVVAGGVRDAPASLPTLATSVLPGPLRGHGWPARRPCM